MALMFKWWLMILEFKVFFTMCWHRSNGLNEFPSALQITHCHLSLDRAILLMETIFIGYITYHHFLNLLRKKGWLNPLFRRRDSYPLLLVEESHKFWILQTILGRQDEQSRRCSLSKKNIHWNLMKPMYLFLYQKKNKRPK